MLFRSDAGRAGARTEAREEKLTKMFARVELEGAQLGARAEVLGKEVLRHLTALPRARVTVTLHIEAHAPDGVPADVVRIVRDAGDLVTVRITARVTDNANRTRSVSHVVGISPVENGQNLTPAP